MIKIVYKVSWPICCKAFVEDQDLNDFVARLVMSGLLLSSIQIDIMNFSNPIEVTDELKAHFDVDILNVKPKKHFGSEAFINKGWRQ